MAGLIRVTALAAARRRAGFAFGKQPLVFGRESLLAGIDGLRQIAAIVADPVLLVVVNDEDTPELFRLVTDAERESLRDMVTAYELHEDREGAERVVQDLITRLIADKELQSPEDAEDEEDDAAASESDAGAKADGGTDAAPAVDNPPASDAAAASGEKSRAGADASGAAPAAGADAGKEPGDAQQPPVAAGTERPASPAGDAANPAAAAPAAAAATQPKKGDAVPAKPAKAKAVAKPRDSSGRKPAASPPPAKG